MGRCKGHGAIGCYEPVIGKFYCVCGGIDTTVPVDVYVPGCSVRPEALIAAIDQVIGKMAEDQKKGGLRVRDTRRTDKSEGAGDEEGEHGKRE